MTLSLNNIQNGCVQTNSPRLHILHPSGFSFVSPAMVHIILFTTNFCSSFNLLYMLAQQLASSLTLCSAGLFGISRPIYLQSKPLFLRISSKSWNAAFPSRACISSIVGVLKIIHKWNSDVGSQKQLRLRQITLKQSRVLFYTFLG